MNSGIGVTILIFVWGVWALFEKRLAMEIHPVFATLYITVISIVFIPIYLIIGKNLGLHFQFNKSAAMWALLAEICGSGGALLFLYLLSQKSSYWVVATTSAYVVVTMILGVIFLKESISTYSAIGVVLVAGGLVLLNLK
jgi:uncharacterized membrane protein